MTDKTSKLKVRQWKKSDIPALVQLHKEVYPDYGDNVYDTRIFELQLRKFPEGQFLVEEDKRIVGYACAIIVQLDEDNAVYTYSEITGGGTFATHTRMATAYTARISPFIRTNGVKASRASSTKRGSTCLGKTTSVVWSHTEEFLVT